MDPIARVLEIIPYSFLQPSRLRLKLPSFSLPSTMTVYSFILLTYFMVVSDIVYDVIVEPPGIGSTQDHATSAVNPVVFLSGRVNGQYIIQGLSSGFMFVLGGVGIVLMNLALDRDRAKSVKISFASAGITFVVIDFGSTFSGALIDEHGRVQAIWGSFSTQALVKKDPVRRQDLRVKGCFVGSSAENLLEQGDMILAINKESVTCFRDIEDAFQLLD